MPLRSLTPQPQFVPPPELPLAERGRFRPRRRRKTNLRARKPPRTLTPLQEAALRTPVKHRPPADSEGCRKRRKTSVDQIWKDAFARRRRAKREERAALQRMRSKPAAP